MKVVLIKWIPRWESDCEDIVGIAASQAAAEEHATELSNKYYDCYGKQHGRWVYEEFDLIGA